MLKIQCRLDFFLISKELRSDTHACNIIKAPETDHSAVTLHLKTEDLLQPKAPGFWKFNSSLLDDEDFTSAIRESPPDFKYKYADLGDLGLKWDLIKMEIRGFTIKYSKIKAKNKRHDFRALTCDKQILIKKQIIWNNRNICIDGKPFYIKSWCRSGIRCIEDLIT